MMTTFLRQISLITLIGVCAVVFPGANALGQNADTAKSYRLGPGDRIVIVVYGEEDLSMDVMLDDTGVIEYPFLGPLQVDGLTVSELGKLLIEGLKGPYLVDPDITVSVKQYRSIYISGEVEKPGAYAYEPGMTIEKAVAIAGGFTERASRNKIDVKRANDPTGQTQRYEITESVRPGDIITVRQSFF